ncbi:MAG: hypothetical protein KJZ65_12600 [Phycisphaerales bacterium]|nr:hypothetical protein [Phycisphaerales bacterium]
MSRKWQRSKAWDEQHIPSWAFGVKFLLQAFSSITLAVVLLVFVSVYATLASVPVGLMVLAPTYVFYAMTLLLPLAVAWVIGVGVVSRKVKGRGARFAASVAAVIVIGLVVAWMWWRFAWPMMRYNPIDGSGVRFFARAVEQYASTTLRRLPAFEMTELEFYSWWPMRVALLAFVVNMIVATVRRIEFCFKNIGVLTVHTGIIVIALGSVYYQSLKKEGNTLLAAGVDPSSGVQGIGPPQGAFFDGTRVVLDVRQDRTGMGAAAWEQRPLRGLPRYNDYGLEAGVPPDGLTLWGLTGREVAAEADGGRTLSIVAPATSELIDPDIGFRVVGYATYAELEADWIRREPEEVPGDLRPLRVVSIFGSGQEGNALGDALASFAMMPSVPGMRVREGAQLSFEYTLSMDEGRWRDLTEPLPEGTRHALVIEVPGVEGLRLVAPVSEGAEVSFGQTGYRVRVERLSPTPPMSIITRGYEGATSSVAIVRITTPDGRGFQRWVYSRFPELNQDILDAAGAAGRPIRRDADSAIRVGYIDASVTRVNMDERADGTLRAAVREPGGALRVAELNEPGAKLTGIDGRFDVALTERWEHGEVMERPRPVPGDEQDKREVGSHARASIAVEVSVGDWRKTVWVPFTQYMGVSGEEKRSVRLPDGRLIELAFARLQHPFPGFQVQLVNFEMIAYDHRGAPRDYQSVLRVSPKPRNEAAFDAYTHVCKLNAPLRAPFHWDEQASWMSNMLRRLAAGINPNQFKMSQAGWDQQGWAQSQQLVDQGALERPFVRFTILGVGNNPGIHIIAAGSVLMALGIPWAFYVKPWLVRREKVKIQKSLASRSAVEAERVVEVGTETTSAGNGSGCWSGGVT